MKIGIIGLGYWGPKLARNFHDLPDVELAWGCDLVPSRLEHIAHHYPEVRTTQDYHDLIV